jgi:hypothetical protein
VQAEAWSANTHNTPAARTWRAPSFVHGTTSCAPLNPKMEPCPPQEAWDSPMAMSCHLRVARRLPRRSRRRPLRDPPRACAMGSTITQVTPGAAVGRVLCTTHRTHQISMHTKTLAKMARGHETVVELPLT